MVKCDKRTKVVVQVFGGLFCCMIFWQKRRRILYAETMTTSGTMNVLLLLLAMLHNGIAITEYKELEKYLLTKLDLRKRPVVEKDMDVPSATMDLYKSMLEQKTVSTNFPLPGLHTKSANTARSYVNKGSVPVNVESKKYRLQFDINSLPENEQVQAAEVRFTMYYNKKLQDNEFVHVLIHDIVQPGKKGISKPILRLMDSKSINLLKVTKSEVISFDVTPTLDRMIEGNFKENHGMIVQCLTMSGAPVHYLDVFDFETAEKPLLMVYTDDGNGKRSLTDGAADQRSKRSADADAEVALADEPAGNRKKPKRKICQRYPLYVDFRDVGFNDWIQAPQGYDAYYCHGECTFPLANHMNTTNHAVMQTLMSSVNPVAVPRPCCVPTKLRAQTLLYVDDEGKLVVKTYPDMAVDECGCR